MAEVIRKTNTEAWARLDKAFKALSGAELKAGWFSTNRYKDGTPVAHVATIHEFGSLSSNIPPRPFMRPTIAREENKWRAFTKQEAKKILKGTQTVEGFLEELGLNVSGEIARSISDVMTPELKPATIRAKLRKLADQGTVGKVDKPLVETGIMLGSASYTVNNGTPKTWDSGGGG